MKRVIIVRHAKAVPYGYDDDYSRDLTDRGVSDAQRIGKELKKMGITPDIMISSPANRAIQTALIFAESTNFNKKQIIEIEDIYHGLTTSEFLGLIHELSEDVKTAFFFGHNPAFQYFVNNLLERFYDDMPTCSTVAIDFIVDSWKKVQARSGTKAFQLIPAMFR
ncbi:MAG TPA: histidine phosphatase family protein [Draconibacterium sp.]|jgi:phosphohistidine phosphatase|nr:histidine phosphatase family protein [Draconibacterium sp.]